jgi:hypothetical protein
MKHLRKVEDTSAEPEELKEPEEEEEEASSSINPAESEEEEDEADSEEKGSTASSSVEPDEEDEDKDASPDPSTTTTTTTVDTTNDDDDDDEEVVDDDLIVSSSQFIAQEEEETEKTALDEEAKTPGDECNDDDPTNDPHEDYVRDGFVVSDDELSTTERAALKERKRKLKERRNKRSVALEREIRSVLKKTFSRASDSEISKATAALQKVHDRALHRCEKEEEEEEADSLSETEIVPPKTPRRAKKAALEVINEVASVVRRSGGDDDDDDDARGSKKKKKTVTFAEDVIGSGDLNDDDDDTSSEPPLPKKLKLTEGVVEEEITVVAEDADDLASQPGTFTTLMQSLITVYCWILANKLILPKEKADAEVRRCIADNAFFGRLYKNSCEAKQSIDKSLDGVLTSIKKKGSPGLKAYVEKARSANVLRCYGLQPSPQLGGSSSTISEHTKTVVQTSQKGVHTTVSGACIISIASEDGLIHAIVSRGVAKLMFLVYMLSHVDAMVKDDPSIGAWASENSELIETCEAEPALFATALRPTIKALNQKWCDYHGSLMELVSFS